MEAEYRLLGISLQIKNALQVSICICIGITSLFFLLLLWGPLFFFMCVGIKL